MCTTDILRDLDFLESVGDEFLEKLAKIARKVVFPANHVIFREGDPADTLYVICAGNVSLEICASGIGCRRILTVGEGEMLGWSSLLEQNRLTATARTLTETTAVAISGSQIRTLCEHNPRFGYEFMGRAALALAKRLIATRLQLLDVFGSQMPVGSDEVETKGT
jgi:CRP-like cAMP-binding protein